MGIDIVLINPGDRKEVYQDLGADFSAIEPPFLAASMASNLKGLGLSAAVVDSNALNITPAETAKMIKDMDPLLAAVMVYGQQPSASTQNMTISGKICRALKDEGIRTAMGGLHPTALPQRTMREEAVDFVIQGEGAHTLRGLISALKGSAPRYSDIPGLLWRDGAEIRQNAAAPLITDLDQALPIAAWNELPMEKYRAHNWHCFDDIDNRSPYASIYTSLGCPWSCVFCCINAPFGKPGIRYRSPRLVVDEIALLREKFGVKNLKIIDELFVLDERHYMAIVEGLMERDYGLNIWAYARVDTVKKEKLARMKRAGVNWLALGIESANPDVRDGAQKRMRARDIKAVVRSIQDEGIRVIGNYIFGLPDDTLQTMRETLDLALELNCEFANFYCAMAYPGSKLYDMAIEGGWELPKVWHGFSQHSYEMQPLPSRHVSAAEVLAFRDRAFHEYFENAGYLESIRKKFGPDAREHVSAMTGKRLKRRLLENECIGGVR